MKDYMLYYLHMHIILKLYEAAVALLLYGRWIYSYLFAISAYHLKLWVWIPLMYSIQYYVVIFSVTWDCFLRPLQIKLTETIFNATAIWLKRAWSTKSQTNIDSFPIIEVQLDNECRENLEI